MAEGKRNENRGVRGGKRAHQKHTDPRQKPNRVQSREQAAAERARLDAEVARGQAETAARLAEVEASAAAAVAEQQRAERIRTQDRIRAARVSRELRDAEAAALAAERKAQWTLGQARSLIRQGYSILQASRLTGWEEFWLEP